MSERRNIRSFGNESSLEALAATVAVIVKNQVAVNGIPIENLIAKEMGIEDWDSESAEREIIIYLQRLERPLQSAVNIEYILEPSNGINNSTTEAEVARVEDGGLAGS